MMLIGGIDAADGKFKVRGPVGAAGDVDAVDKVPAFGQVAAWRAR
jgi:hypothetical protein